MSVNAPATRKSFEVKEDSKLLGFESHDTYHRIVEKLIHVAKRFRLDIKLANSFLCIRVSFSTEQYWGKLKMLLKYLKGTKTEYLTLGMNGIELMEIWIDSSYAIHQYMKDPYWRIDINGKRGCDYQILKTEY